MNAFEAISESEQHYNAARAEFLTSSQLKQLRHTGAIYIPTARALREQPLASLLMVGRAAHKLILEGKQALNESFIVSDGGLTHHIENALTTEEWLRVEAMAEAVAEYTPARRLLQRGVPEGVVRAIYRGAPCQIRMDWFNPDELYLVDLKTTSSLAGFQEDIQRYEYLWQLAFYRAVLGTAAGICPQKIRCYLLAVESVPPHRVSLFPAKPPTLTVCQMENEQAIKRWLGNKQQDAQGLLIKGKDYAENA